MKDLPVRLLSSELWGLFFMLSAFQGKTEDFKFAVAKSSLYMVFVAYLNSQCFGEFCNASFRRLTLDGILQLDHVTCFKTPH